MNDTTAVDQIILQPHQAFVLPGQSGYWTISLSAGLPQRVLLEVVITHLAEAVWVERRQVQAGTSVLALAWQVPEATPSGYGLEVRLLDGDRQLGRLSSAFDVLEHWAQMPRYGFLTDFSPERGNVDHTLDLLARYSINGLQFYDWMYRHDTLLPQDEPYLDPLDRKLSLGTVEELIAAAHQRRMAAMPYTAVYGASLDFHQDHLDWGLFDAEGQPETFFDFLAIMDPRPDSPWSRHLLGQYQQVLEHTAFDGIHIDQYGDPKTGFDVQGHGFDLAQPLAEFIAASRQVVDRLRPDGTVVFNAVGNWPIESVAPAPQDLVYIEIWPPDTHFVDLQRIIVQAQALGGGKPVVIAAYIDPAAEANVRLADAVVFASGGGRIELGEMRGGGPGYLSDPYFPKYSALSPQLAEQLRRLYAFAVRYQDVIGPRTIDATPFYRERISLRAGGAPVSSDPAAVKDKIWPIVRQTEGYTAVSLINLMGLAHPDWNDPLPGPPQTQQDLLLEISAVEMPVKAVWLASPDREDLSLQPLSFELAEGQLQIPIPELAFWDLVLIEWEPPS